MASGKSLAQIAQARGKSVSGLERALIAATTSRLNQAVRAGHLSQAIERHILAALSQHVRMIVTMKGSFGSSAPGRFHLWMRPGAAGSGPGGPGMPPGGPPPLRGGRGWAPPGPPAGPLRGSAAPVPKPPAPVGQSS
jgi:hypothetical protein